MKMGAAFRFVERTAKHRARNQMKISQVADGKNDSCSAEPDFPEARPHRYPIIAIKIDICEFRPLT